MLSINALYEEALSINTLYEESNTINALYEEADSISEKGRSHAGMSHMNFKKIIRKYEHKFHTALFPITGTLFSLLPVKNNRVVAVSFRGNGIGDNPGAICESLHQRDPEAEIVWLVDRGRNRTIDLPEWVREVPYYSFRSMLYMATAKVWIDNCRKDYMPRKKKDQIYIQTWHGGLGFKKVEAAAQQDLSEFYIRVAKRDTDAADLMVSNGEMTTRIYRTMFRYQGRVLECGLPRNDCLVRTDHLTRKEEAKRALGIESDHRLLLYAPTYRDMNDLSAFSFDMDAFLRALEKKTGDKWTGAVRLHPNLQNCKIPALSNDRILDLTHIPDPNQVLLASDAMVSDYSSMVFDFAGTGGLVLLYAPDYDEYMQRRGLWLTYDQTPFPSGRTNEELLEKLNDLQIISYQKELKKFFDDFHMAETGRSSETAAEVIRSVLRGKPLEMALREVCVPTGDGRYLLKNS